MDDESGLLKLTNPPLHEELASFPKGTVEVTVANSEGVRQDGSFVVVE